MKLFRGNFGWSTTAHSKTKDGKELKCYMDTQFAKKCEPQNYNEVEGKLIFRSRGGIEYDCFFSSYEKQGLVIPKLILMPMGEDKQEQIPLTNDNNRDMFGRKQEVKIDTEELPFY
jgi:hypothetical protein